MYRKQCENGITIFSSDSYGGVSIIGMNSRFYVRILNCNNWEYTDAVRGFKSISDANAWIQKTLCSVKQDKEPIMSAINTRELSENMVRVKSSNVWAYKMNVKDKHSKTGSVLVQFKNKNGGPGDIYIYYDVPTILYRRWQSAPSKGHFFWQYLRDYYRYGKLTGDKRGKLSNAI